MQFVFVVGTVLITDCGPLANPSNGQVRKEGLVVIYNCEIGYNLIGNSIRSCGSNQSWSSSAPVCVHVVQNLDAIIGSVVAVIAVLYIIGMIILLAVILCCWYHKLKKIVQSSPACDVETVELRGERYG